MVSYSVGDKVCQPSADGVIFDLDDSGATLQCKFAKPTVAEVKAFKSGLSFKFVVVEDIIFILSRMGAGQWMDSPYYKHRAPNLTDPQNLQDPEEGKGLGVTAMLIDASTGVLKAIKLVGLETDLTRRLFAAIREQPKIVNYTERLNRIMATYTTNDLVELADEQAQQVEEVQGTETPSDTTPLDFGPMTTKSPYVIDNPFEEIEGLKEIIITQGKWIEWIKAMDSQAHGEHVNLPPHPEQGVLSLCQKYPKAYTYLVLYDYATSEHPGRAAAGQKAMHRFLLGEDYERVLTDMEHDWEAYCEEHGENPLNREWDVDKHQS